MSKPIIFLSADTAMVGAVSAHLAPKGVAVPNFPSLDALEAGIGGADIGAVPSVVLVADTRTLPQGRDLMWLTDRVAQLSGARPLLVCIAHCRDIDLRLQALRAGAEAFFVNPVAEDELTARLLVLSGAPGADSPRVLIVDDQPVVALFSARVLEGAGMQTRIVSDALCVLDVLEELRPDLVLMDLHMPGADGIELTALIREHEEFYDTPVIFLSSELDKEKQIDAFRVGGNDFVAKPIHPDRLIDSVRRGILASRPRKEQQRCRHDLDAVTGLMNRTAFLIRLDAALARGCEQGPGAGLLMVHVALTAEDANPTESIALDDLMNRFAKALRSRLGGLECAARFGNTRFALLARRESEAVLLELAKSLGSELATVAAADPVEIRVGVAAFHPPAADALAMISRAQKACLLARRGDAQGSRVGIYRPPMAEDADSQFEEPLSEEVEQALRAQAFHLTYQPIVALRHARGERYGVTLRLKVTEGEYLPALEFLPEAQSRGLGPAIDRWVMAHALGRLEQERDAHPGLRFFVPQTMETLRADDWLSWLRSQIAERDLIKQRPILQFQLDDLSSDRALATIRFGELRRLAIDTCLSFATADPRVFDLIGELEIPFVRLSLEIGATLEADLLTDFVASAHALGTGVIIARIEQPQTIARVFSCGVDFIQGKFLQLPSEELSFDFSESAMG